MAASARAGDGTPLNVATGRETTVNELAEQVIALCGSRAGVRHAAARAGEITRSVADVSRLAAGLDVRAEVTLAGGLAQTVAWLQGAAQT